MRAGAPAVIFDDDFKDRNQALRMAEPEDTRVPPQFPAAFLWTLPLYPISASITENFTFYASELFTK